MADTALPARLETERLVLRPLAPEDLDFFVALHGDPDVIRYMGGDGTPRTPEVTRAWLEKMLGWYERGAPAPYAFVRKEDGALVGRGGLSIFELERTPSAADGVPVATWGLESAAPGVEVERVVELGYVVSPTAWGQGYAPEASAAWLRHAFEERDEPVVHSMIHPENVASLRVAAKNGMRPGRVVRHDGRDYTLFERRR